MPRTVEQRVREIYDEGPKLTTWEADFLESIEVWEGALTENQEEKLCEIEDKAGTRSD